MLQPGIVHLTKAADTSSRTVALRLEGLQVLGKSGSIRPFALGQICSTQRSAPELPARSIDLSLELPGPKPTFLNYGLKCKYVSKVALGRKKFSSVLLGLVLEGLQINLGKEISKRKIDKLNYICMMGVHKER